MVLEHNQTIEYPYTRSWNERDWMALLTVQATKEQIYALGAVPQGKRQFLEDVKPLKPPIMCPQLARPII